MVRNIIGFIFLLLGRARIFHGVNVVSIGIKLGSNLISINHVFTNVLKPIVIITCYSQVYKNFPYYPTNSTFDHELSLNTEDIEFLVENGFNVVRLYVAWPGVEPKKGEYNHTYLKVMALNIKQLSTKDVVSQANLFAEGLFANRRDWLANLLKLVS